MATGFRKSLFGFNCDDVMAYIEKTHKSFKDKETELNEKVDELNGELKSANDSIAEISHEKEVISEELLQFKQKADEIERLSDNIGKLYLVAQANAQALMKDSENSSKLAAEEIEKNISSIDDAHISLTAMKQEILKTTEDFAKDIDSLLSSLNDTKSQIINNSKLSESKSQEFKEIYASLTK